MTWDNFWAYFVAASSEIKAYLWKEIDLVNHIKGLAPKYQTEVLKNAPADVMQLVKDCIYLDTKIKLEKKNPSASRTIRLVLK